MTTRLRPPGVRGSSSFMLSARACAPGIMDTQLLSVVAAATCPPAVALLPVRPPAGKHRLTADDFLETCHLLFAGLLMIVTESLESQQLHHKPLQCSSQKASLHIQPTPETALNIVCSKRRLTKYGGCISLRRYRLWVVCW